MILNMHDYTNTFKNLNINISYSGPMWNYGIKGIAEMVKVSLSHDDIQYNAAKSIFSVFVEQVTNMLMHSAEKKQIVQTNDEYVSFGMLLLGSKDKTYFIQTGNAIKNENIEFIKSKIDHLNALDRNKLRQFYKEKMRSENDNPKSKGAGLGLIEIAKRATAPIRYSFEPIEDGLSYFSLYVEIAQKEI